MKRIICSPERSDQPGYTAASDSGDSGTTPSAYQGYSGQIVREVAPGTSMAVNADAQLTFDPLFRALSTLQVGLSLGSSTTIQTSLTQFDSALDGISAQRAQIGARTNRLEFLKARQSEVNVNLTGLLSELKDVDMAAAITNFAMAQNVYQASLKAGAQALQPSLLEYLR